MNASGRRLTGYKTLISLICITGCIAGACSVANARPNMAPLGPNIADKGSAVYHFTVKTFDSADGQRHYKVWTAIPDKAPPVKGYPVLYMLDGNSVMDKLSEPLLEKLSQHNPPVIIAVGYQTDLPFDLKGRTYDYTPEAASRDGSALQLDRRGRPTGGSLIFRKLLEGTIAPQTEQNLPLNTARRGVWGHSFAGLWVLDSYVNSDFFHQYYAASPSLGQMDFGLLTQMVSLPVDRLRDKQLFLMEGDGDPQRKNAAPGNDVLGAVSKTVTQLHDKGIAASYLLFPGLSHGQMFPASLEEALLRVSQP
ncbi:alpha/beta hydrolase [Tatumella citrea]|uniref:Salmochelin siderophore protein IroE n=1 Tax=Tatumella citrea TaxID=53336 RepID=A0A1Y0LFS1_TATCI|nr:alpha/beta hydrolase-fold protein [Tatumella citrea]ARU92908.1 hypothetical protein A7K98_03300 [Tatumella citrea]ARU96946.1 hypothetical protein A7K99_03300 [Tatumella citrea]